MKFALLVASVSAIQLTDPEFHYRYDTVDGAVAQHNNQQIAYNTADDQAENVRHHYGKMTPSGTNW